MLNFRHFDARSALYERERSNVETDEHIIDYGSHQGAKPKNITSDVKSIEYDAINQKYRIVFNNDKEYSYNSTRIKFEKKACAFDAFRYLKGTCEAIRPIGTEYESYLLNQYKEIDSMRLDGLSLCNYIAPSQYPPKIYKKPEVILYPFGINLSQMQAIENALSSQMSIIEGPPGTGKTQTILNIIVNLIIQDKSVLVVSPNNSATDNIVDKLIAKGYGFLVARLGSKVNIEGFQNKQTGKYPEELSTFSVASNQIERSRRIVAESTKRIRSFLESQRAYRMVVARLDDACQQHYFFTQEHPEILAPRQHRMVSRNQALKIYKYIQKLSIRNELRASSKALSLLKRMRFWLIDGVGDWSFYKKPLGDMEGSLFALALASARNAVIVGDVKQLSPVISPEEAGKINEYSKTTDHYCYTKHSLLSSLKSLIDNNLLTAPRELLREHYRCNPKIIGFCNEKYYDGELILMTENRNDIKEVLKVIYTEGLNLDRVGDYNRRQADDFAHELDGLANPDTFDSIGVVTPYKRQVKGMINDDRFKRNTAGNGIAIATTHAYQGREKDVIAFLTVRNKITPFLDNPNLVNVAVSRAKECLMVFASDALINTADDTTNNISELVRYIQYQGGEVKASAYSSIYDVLYDEKKLHATLKKISNSVTGVEPSEMLTENELQKIIFNHDLHHSISYCLRYPLIQLFSATLPLNKREQDFLHQGAHVDFIVHRIMDRTPLFGIEVNGSQHYSNPKQQERDKLKESIFKKAGLPLCILPTHGRAEPERLKKALLDSVMSSRSDTTTQRLTRAVTIPAIDELNDWLDSLDSLNDQ